mgnify:CR=1 FL=1
MAFILNIGTWLGWGSKVTDAAQGKENVAGNAKNLFSKHWFSSQPKITASALKTLISQYETNPPNAITSTAGTSVYYMYIAFTIIAKSLYNMIQSGWFNEYKTRLGDMPNVNYKLSEPINDSSDGAKLFVFMMHKVRENVIGLKEGELIKIVGAGAIKWTPETDTNLKTFIKDQLFTTKDMTSIKNAYQKFKTSGQYGGRKCRRKRTRRRVNHLRKTRSKSKSSS